MPRHPRPRVAPKVALAPLVPLVALAALVVSACATDGAGAPARAERTATARQAILAGEPEPAPLAVAVFTRPVPSLTVCSGALVAANLVLTARHCVAAFTGPTGRSFCGPTGVRGGATRPVDALGVTTDAEVSERSVRRAVKQVHLPPAAEPIGDVPLCGADLALLELEEPLDAPPLVPRLDDPPRVGEPLRVLGYGRDGRDAARAGTRQTSTPTPVLGLGGLVGDDGTVLLDPRELLLGPAACDGDSGGPLLDDADRVVAVVSHGKTVDDEATCGEGGHTRVDAHAEWLRTTARDVAAAAGLAPPGWAIAPDGDAGAEAGPPPPPAAGAAPDASPPSTGPAAGEGGCAVGAPTTPGGGADGRGSATAVLAAVLVALVAQGSRRTRRTPSSSPKGARSFSSVFTVGLPTPRSKSMSTRGATPTSRA